MAPIESSTLSLSLLYYELLVGPIDREELITLQWAIGTIFCMFAGS